MQKSRSVIIRNLILVLILSVCIFLIVIAWFTNNPVSNASGLSVTSVKSLGLESSFDNVNFATEITRDDLNAHYPLISGDGTNFFLPSLDYSTGEPLTNSDGSWISKREVVKNEDYYVQDVYFRSTSKVNVFLTQNSKIIPNDIKNHTMNNKSDFGDFTKDYIAGASRVSVFNVDNENNNILKYTWVPNDTYELVGETNFEKIAKTQSGDVTVDSDPDKTMGIDTYDSSTYYLWEYNTSTTNYQKRQMKIKNNVLYGAIDVNVGANVDHGIIVNNGDTSSAPQKDFTDFIKGSEIGCTDATYGGIYGSIDGNYYVGDYQWVRMTLRTGNDGVKNEFFGKYGKFQVLVTYDLSSKKLSVSGFVYYSNGSTTPGGGTIGGAESYELTDGKQIVVTATYNSVLNGLAAENEAVTSGVLTEASTGKITYVSSKYQFTVVKNSSASDQYALKSLKTGTYLYIDTSGNVALSESPVYFTLSVATNGPALKCNNFYLYFNGTDFASSYNLADSNINIYQGASYSMNTESTNTEQYKFYNQITNTVDTMENTRITSQLNQDDNNVLVTLEKKNPEDYYYVGHIKLVIWAEGTDREAKYPLANGIFTNEFEFQGIKIET